MEEYNRDAWDTLIERCEEVGVDAFEVNFSCPHGMPERKMGMAMGQDCTVLEVSAPPKPYRIPSEAAGREAFQSHLHCVVMGSFRCQLCSKGHGTSVKAQCLGQCF